MAHDTAPIRPEEGFDERRVAAYLREALPELVADHDIVFDQFPGGAANLTYRATAGDVELVLRRAPLGPVAQGAHDMAREYRVLSRLWRVFPKAPRAYAFCDDAEIMGKPFFVMERRRGWVIRAAWPPDFGDDIEVRRRLAVDLVVTLAELHRIDPASVDLAGLGRPEGFVERQIAGWARRWDAAKTREVGAMDHARRLLEQHLPSPQAQSILHNDYKLDNTMVSGTGEVVAVFDWDMATRGDPLVDLGTLLAYWADPDGPTYPVFGERAVTLAPYLSKAELVAQYAETTGFDVSGVGYYEGLALYRIAVIIEQIYARYVAGQTTDARFAAFEPLAPLLARAAVDVLEGT
ncbi:MAG TPA: phosphotransferase family protein [Acidimicrobiia bacterium]|nr:phosphotransferase family protein [Acidimicrobiia bacterium]